MSAREAISREAPAARESKSNTTRAIFDTFPKKNTPPERILHIP
jgi:hypothetical protein